MRKALTYLITVLSILILFSSAVAQVPGAENIPDLDGDGICDGSENVLDEDGNLLCTGGPDNCPSTPNPGQEDVDGDGMGGACQLEVFPIEEVPPEETAPELPEIEVPPMETATELPEIEELLAEETPPEETAPEPPELPSGDFPTDPILETLDPDGDGLFRDKEVELGTDPNNPDTDSDYLDDGTEIDAGTDPLNPDSDSDGLLDGEEFFGPDFVFESGDESNPLDTDDPTHQGVSNVVAPDNEERTGEAEDNFLDPDNTGRADVPTIFEDIVAAPVDEDIKSIAAQIADPDPPTVTAESPISGRENPGATGLKPSRRSRKIPLKTETQPRINPQTGLNEILITVEPPGEDACILDPESCKEVRVVVDNLPDEGVPARVFVLADGDETNCPINRQEQVIIDGPLVLGDCVFYGPVDYDGDGISDAFIDEVGRCDSNPIDPYNVCQFEVDVTILSTSEGARVVAASFVVPDIE